jgi:hypothetical protein
MALNETDIFGGKAIIFQNDFDICQFRTWRSEEKQNVRKSHKTKDKHQATNYPCVQPKVINCFNNF